MSNYWELQKLRQIAAADEQAEQIDRDLAARDREFDHAPVVLPREPETAA